MSKAPPSEPPVDADQRTGPHGHMHGHTHGHTLTARVPPSQEGEVKPRAEWCLALRCQGEFSTGIINLREVE